jgi:hypothetical protein
MAKKDYNSINFKNKDVDKFATKFNQTNGDPKKKEPAKQEPQGERNPEWLKGEKENGRNWSPYSVNTQANEVKTPVKQSFTKAGYGPKSGWEYVQPGELTKQDSLDINVNRAPTVRNLTLVSKEMAKGTKFPGLSPEFKSSLKTYEKLPAKFK